MSNGRQFVCPCCAWTTMSVHGLEETCVFCKTEMIETKYTTREYLTDPNVKPAIFEEYVKNNPLYDPKKEAEKEAILEEKRIRRESRSYNSGNNNVPKCPTCGSTNIRRISTLDRAVSVGILGIFSGKIGKNYECLNCKAKW